MDSLDIGKYEYDDPEFEEMYNKALEAYKTYKVNDNEVGTARCYLSFWLGGGI